MTASRKIVMLGGGGTAKDVLGIIEDINRIDLRYDVTGILDDNLALKDQSLYGTRVVGPLEQAKTLNDVLFVNCLGSPRNYWKRENIITGLGLSPDRFATLIHPSAVMSPSSTIGHGVVIYPHVVVMAGVRIGDHVVVLANTVMNHDVIVEDYCIITSGVNVSGRVRLQRGCYIGVGSSLIQDCTVGEWALVGLGSAVIRDVPPWTVVAGSPARAIRKVRNEGLSC
jgi:sugar O-acyltransferase (sialic acid O-acetyltransferase NeuD family)